MKEIIGFRRSSRRGEVNRYRFYHFNTKKKHKFINRHFSCQSIIIIEFVCIYIDLYIKIQTIWLFHISIEILNDFRYICVCVYQFDEDRNDTAPIIITVRNIITNNGFSKFTPGGFHVALL